MTYEEKRTKATELRHARNYSEALKLYKELYAEIDDKFNSSGLLHCLRKTNNWEEAVSLADEIKSKHIEFNWFKNEIVWTYIQGKLNKLDENRLTEATEIAKEVLELNPDSDAKASIILRVLKLAKKKKEWKVVYEWSSKLNPN